MIRLYVAGAGAAGVSAAIWAKRLGLSPRLCDQQRQIGGQLSEITLPIVDLPGWGEVSSEELRQRWEEELLRWEIPLELGKRVVAFDRRQHSVRFADGDERLCTHLIYSPGLRTRKLEVPGELAVDPQLSVSDFIRGRPPASPSVACLVVGGGDRALEAACRLAEWGADTALAVRSQRFRARPAMIRRLEQGSATVHWQTRVTAIMLQDGEYRVRLESADGHWIWKGSGLFIRIGMEPNPLVQLLPEDFDDTRYHFQVIGDAMTDPPYRSLVSALASGMRAAKNVSLVE